MAEITKRDIQRMRGWWASHYTDDAIDVEIYAIMDKMITEYEDRIAKVEERPR